MKKLFFLLLLPAFLNAQNKIYDTSEIISVDSTKADVLYSRAKAAIAKLFISGKDVTQLNDDNSKTIIVKPLIKNTFNTINHGGDWGYTSYTISIQCKDNKYKYSLGDFLHHPSYENPAGYALDGIKPDFYYTTKRWDAIKQQDNEQLMPMLVQLKKMMSTSNENW